MKLTFDQRYDFEAKTFFNQRQQLEQKKHGESFWTEAPVSITDMVYKSIDVKIASQLASGMKLSDGSYVRFKIK